MNNPFHSDAAGKLILRLMVGGLILFHGVSKILNPVILEPIKSGLAGMGLPAFVAYGVYFGEVLAPLLIIFGVMSRLGGLFIVINMVFAVLLVHTSQLLTLSKTGGWAVELQAFYLLGGLAIIFLGSGRLAIKPD